MPEEPIGYLLWWNPQNRWFYYCPECSKVNINHWRQQEAKFWPVYIEHIGKYSQKCGNFHENGRYSLCGEVSTVLFDQESLFTLPRPEDIHA